MNKDGGGGGDTAGERKRVRNVGRWKVQSERNLLASTVVIATTHTLVKEVPRRHAEATRGHHPTASQAGGHGV